MSWLWVALGAAFGAPARYLTDRAVQRWHASPFPFGTLTVNLVGSLVLGVLVGSADHGGASSDLLLLAGTGFCGAFTTFSTFGFETVRLLEEGSVLEAGLNALGSLVLGVLAAAAGFALAALLA